MSSSCCAECGKEEGGVSLKMCKPCMLVKYCNAECQKNHWPTHKAGCKLRAAEIRDEALFKDPPAKEDCPICFIPMPSKLIRCVLLPPATILSVPIYDFAQANKELAAMGTDGYYQCCGKNICRGCVYSFGQSGNDDKCPFCNSKRIGKTDEEDAEDNMKRAEANDAASIWLMAGYYYRGLGGLQQDHAKAIELLTKSAELGCSQANWTLADVFFEEGNMKKAKLYYEAAAMAGYEVARHNLGNMEYNYGNIERAVKHWTIAASAGHFIAMHELRILFDQGVVSRESIDSTLAAYNNSCAEFRSEARDACIQSKIETI
jgi:TPR repeat protein